MIGMGWRGNKGGDRLDPRRRGQGSPRAQGQGRRAPATALQHASRSTVRDAEHPVTKGMPTEWMHAADELYDDMRGPIENVHLLATAYSDKAKGGTGEHEPMIWTVTYGKGRVFHTPMGHDVDAMRCVGFLATLQRGTEWAATGKVTLPLPDELPDRGQDQLAAGEVEASASRFPLARGQRREVERFHFHLVLRQDAHQVGQVVGAEGAVDRVHQLARGGRVPHQLGPRRQRLHQLHRVEPASTAAACRAGGPSPGFGESCLAVRDCHLPVGRDCGRLRWVRRTCSRGATLR